MICPNCQREVPDTAKACGYCGQWLVDEVDEPTVKLEEESTTVGPAETGGGPPWLWIGIGVGVLALVLLVGLLAFTAGRGGGAVDTEATVAAAVAATQQAVAADAGGAETEPPEPPAKLREAPPPVPEAPVPLYDDFNDSDLDGSYNQGLWLRPDETMGNLVQKDGLLIAEQGPAEPDSITILAAREYHFVPIEAPFSFEARVLLDSNPGGGSVLLAFSVETADGDWWWTDCSVQVGSAGCWADPDAHLFGKDVEPDTWRTLRIDVVPDPIMTFYYSIDGELVNRFEPYNAEALRTARFAPKIGVYSENGEPVLGYIDEVRIGRPGR